MRSLDRSRRLSFWVIGRIFRIHCDDGLVWADVFSTVFALLSARYTDDWENQGIPTGWVHESHGSQVTNVKRALD